MHAGGDDRSPLAGLSGSFLLLVSCKVLHFVACFHSSVKMLIVQQLTVFSVITINEVDER